MRQFDPIHLMIVGAISVGYGTWNYFDKKSRLKRCVRTTGSVENIRRDREGNTTVTVKCTGPNGEKLTLHLMVSDTGALGLGSEVAVAYDPKRPQEAFAASQTEMNLAAIASIGMGAIFIVCGIVILLAGTPWEKR